MDFALFDGKIRDPKEISELSEGRSIIINQKIKIQLSFRQQTTIGVRCHKEVKVIKIAGLCCESKAIDLILGNFSNQWISLYL